MISKMATVTSVMCSVALILLAALNLDAVAAPPPPQNTPVTVTNTPAGPVPTVDVENPAKQPFAASGFANTSSPASGEILTTVPAGKRLVVEMITLIASIDLSGSQLVPVINIVTNGNQFPHAIIVNSAGQGATQSFWNSTHAVRFYADPATEVRLICFARISANQSCNVSISGYFVNVP